MITFRILLYHILLISFALASPVEQKDKEKSSVAEVSTFSPTKVIASKKGNTELVQGLENAKIEKISTKKRNVPKPLTDKNEYSNENFYEGKINGDYNGNRALRENSRNENSLFDSGKYRVNDYRYYNEESRRKRTATVDDIFRKSDNSREPEIRLSPEDLMILANYEQQHRLYNSFPYGRWKDINNAIDLPEEEGESDEIYERPENFFDRYYDQRYQNWVNLPRSNKFMNRQEKGFTEYPKLRVPLYKRAIL